MRKQKTLRENLTIRAERLVIIAVVLAIAIIIVSSIFQPVNGLQMFENETDINDMFMYPSPSVDLRPMEFAISFIERNQSGYVTSYLDGSGSVIGNISVISSPVGWDLVFEMLVMITICVIVITLCIVALTAYFYLRLHK